MVVKDLDKLQNHFIEVEPREITWFVAPSSCREACCLKLVEERKECVDLFSGDWLHFGPNVVQGMLISSLRSANTKIVIFKAQFR